MQGVHCHRSKPSHLIWVLFAYLSFYTWSNAIITLPGNFLNVWRSVSITNSISLLGKQQVNIIDYFFKVISQALVIEYVVSSALQLLSQIHSWHFPSCQDWHYSNLLINMLLTVKHLSLLDKTGALSGGRTWRRIDTAMVTDSLYGDSLSHFIDVVCHWMCSH